MKFLFRLEIEVARLVDKLTHKPHKKTLQENCRTQYWQYWK